MSAIRCDDLSCPFAESSCSILSDRNTLTRDWYGTSRLFARSFSSSSMDSGRRREIVFTEGFRLASVSLRAFFQSTYSVESWVLQKSLSSSSLLNRGIFFMDGNYFAAQTVVRSPVLHTFWGWDEHMTSPAGTPFPTARMQDALRAGRGMAAFAGWPVAVGHRTAGPRVILAEKAAAERKAEELLERVKAAGGALAPADRAFLVQQFEDLVFFARIYRLVAEVEVHSLLLERNLAIDGLPQRDALDAAVKKLRRVRAEWLNRYPADPWGLARLIDDGLSGQARRVKAVRGAGGA